MWNLFRKTRSEGAAPETAAQTEMDVPMLKDDGYTKTMEEPTFTAANTPEVRRAKAWLEAQFRRAEKTGGFTLDDQEITPVLAELMLAHNTNNRTPRLSRIERLAATVTDGRWVSTACTLRFSTDRVLIDGQTRIMAIVRSGRSAVMDVRFGCKPQAFMVLDGHGVRTAADIFHIGGNENATALAAAARMLYLVKKHGPRHNLSIDNDVLAEFLAKHKGLHESVHYGQKVYRALKCSIAAFTTAHYLIVDARYPADSIDVFFEKLSSGLGLTSKRDPIYKLRDYLLKRDDGKRRSSNALLLGACIKAWNAYAAGRKISDVSIDEQEPFPTVEPRR